MPYVDCGGNVFTAAYWLSVEHCPYCDAVLPHSKRGRFARERPPPGRPGSQHGGPEHSQAARREKR